MFTIKIVDVNSGKPVEGAKVAVGFNGVFRGFTPDKWTDANGECHFTESNGEGTVYVKGKVAFEGDISGRKVIYI